MSSYKVIQDIEAEDKLVGPLTLRQFIYAGISAVCLYISFLLITKGAGFVAVIFVPIAAITGFFAFPWKGEQPTEIWALARLRFMIKPRVRIWNQSGIKDVVTITAPKKLENIRPLTNNLSENEVRSRLKALADTIDSRGWATRNASYSAYLAQRNSSNSQLASSNAAGMAGLLPSDDMFDGRSSVAQNFDAMLTKSSHDQRQRVMQQMAQASMPQAQMQQQSPPYQQAAMQQPMAQQAAPPQSYQQPAVYQQQAPAVQQYAPQPMMAAAPPVNYQSPQLPAPVMPSVPLPSAVPAAPNDYWFNNGPAYPGDQQAQNSQAVPGASNIPQGLSEPFAAALSSGRIMTDVPIATAAAPNANEIAFAEAVKAQNLATQKINYAHMRVLQPVDASGQPAESMPPSVPGMIDYGRPQPVDDQMQYDTSLPQSAQPESGENTSGLVAPQSQSVTHRTDPAILDLANNDDLDVATIARQASKEMKKSPDEVEIRLH